MILFCIPYAGGSSSAFFQWRKYFSSDVTVCPLELRGKGFRCDEEPYENFEEAVDDLFYTYMADQILTQEYMIFGHSMGSLLAYELYYKIKANHFPLPKHIYFSSFSLPTKKREPAHTYSDEDFLAYVNRFGGLNPIVLQYESILKECLGFLRNDFRISYTYQYKEHDEVIACSTSVLRGTVENFTTEYRTQMVQFLGEDFRYQEFEGGHFYLNEHLEEIIQIIKGDMRKKQTKECTYQPLLTPQMQMWYADSLNPKSVAGNIGGRVKIYGELDCRLQERAYNLFLYNNETLRMRITQKNEELLQYAKEYRYETLDFIDFSKKDDPNGACLDWANQKMATKISLLDHPLYYYALYKLSDYEYGILFVGHHIAFDGWSIELLQSKVNEIYRRLQNHETIDIEKMSTIEERLQKEEKYKITRFAKDKEFWLEEIRKISEDNYYNNYIECKGNRLSFSIPSDVVQETITFSKEHHISLNSLFTSLMYLYMYKTLNQEDITLGLPIYNRMGAKEKNTIGMFVSTVVARIHVDSKVSVMEYLKQVESSIKNCLHHQQFPYHELVRFSGIDRFGFNSLYKNSVNYYNFHFDNRTAGLKMVIDELYSGEQTYSMQMIIKQFEESNLELCFDYKVSEYTKAQIKTMYQCMMTMLKQILKSKDLMLQEVQLLDESKLYEKKVERNNTTTLYPKEKSFIQLFEEQVEKTPKTVAVECEKKILTYEELNQRANQFVNYLNVFGINKSDVVAVRTKHSIELFISILAILKMGAIYLPIDPEYPKNRVEYELKDSKAVALFTDLTGEDDMRVDIPTIHVNQVDLSGYDKEIKKIEVSPDDIVYMIYTSGSTGKPKGVMIKQMGLVNYLWWAKKQYLMEEAKSMPLFTSIAFDLSITTIFTPLIAGWSVICYPHEKGELVLDQIMMNNRCTVMKLTPSHLKLLADHFYPNSNLKRLIVGGEELTTSLAEKITECFQNSIEICNEYGPTETVVGCMIHRYDKTVDNGKTVSIGYPADNVQLYVFNQDGNLLPDGVIGELYIGGDGVAQGYLNREEDTKQSFIQHPFEKEKRLYRTFDAVRYTKDGRLEFVSRLNDQIKIRGYRIEIGEIEQCLRQQEDVEEAIVVCNQDERGNKTLVAYVVTKNEDILSSLSKNLKQFLPTYMIPTQYIRIESIPLTSNGKIDYRSLPKAETSFDDFVKAKTENEAILSAILQDVLKVDQVSMQDNFFSVGGDSIHAIQISSKLKERQFDLAVKDIMMSNTIGEIANLMKPSKDMLLPVDEICEGDIANTPILHWFWQQDFKNPNLYNHSFTLQLKGNYDFQLLNTTFQNLLAYEDMLRVHYDDMKKCLIYDNSFRKEDFELPYYDFVDEPEDKANEEIQSLLQTLNGKIHRNHSLFQCAAVRRNEDTFVLLLVAHHMIVDGISWRILVREILDALTNEGKMNSFRRTSYQQWAKQVKGLEQKDMSRELEYWNMVKANGIGYAPDNDKSSPCTYATCKTRWLEYDAAKIKELSKNANEKMNLRLEELLLIALGLTIHSMYQSFHITLENESHGRENIDEFSDISRTVGWFTTIYPVHFQIKSDRLDENVQQMKEQLRKINHHGFYYTLLKYQMKQLGETKQRYIRFNYLGDYNEFLNIPQIDSFHLELNHGNENHMTSYIEINAWIQKDRLKVSFEYSREEFKESTVDLLIGGLKQQFENLMDYMKSDDANKFTPSDFDTLDLSFEDLNQLFS